MARLHHAGLSATADNCKRSLHKCHKVDFAAGQFHWYTVISNFVHFTILRVHFVHCFVSQRRDTLMSY